MTRSGSEGEQIQRQIEVLPAGEQPSNLTFSKRRWYQRLPARRYTCYPGGLAGRSRARAGRLREERPGLEAQKVMSEGKKAGHQDTALSTPVGHGSHVAHR